MTFHRIVCLWVLGLGLSARAETNPLLAPWTGPQGGVPPFDRVKMELFRPAFEVAMDENRREVDAIANSTEPPTFENTLVPLEDSGRAFSRVYRVYNAWSSFMGTPEFQAVEREMAPKLSAFWDEPSRNAKLFARVKAVYDSATKTKLSPEQQRLVDDYYRDFVDSGALLDAASGQRLAAINQRRAQLFTTFTQNMVADEAQPVVLDHEEDLAGLPESVRKALAAEAESHGQPGHWLVANTRSAVADFLTYSDRRDLREKVWRAYNDRGDHGDAHDNNALITEILALRAEQARLMGYPTFAHRQLAPTMVKTPEKALDLMETMWKPAVARVHEEVADMRAIAERSGQKEPIAPWDYRYYAEKVRKAKYDLNEAEIRPYLQLEKLREGMFWLAGEYFGLDFTPAVGVPVYHPDVRVFAVTRRATGRPAGLFYFDPYARQGKYNGGQTTTFRTQERFRGEVTAIVASSMPFVKPAPGTPALLAWRDAQTLFHEFGHAVQELSSDVAYPSLAGTRVVRDYGEFPAKLFEHWVGSPEVLHRFARHATTGQPMPAALMAKIKKAATFNQGYSMVDYLLSALVELKLHLDTRGAIDPAAFERETRQQLGAPSEVGMRFRLPHFGHVFSSDGYAAGYYRYLWADVLAADAFEAFLKVPRAQVPQVAERLRAHVLSVGNTVDPFDGYRAFRGRDATLDALMRERGFTPPTPAPRSPQSKSL
ncbi:M3 family metallopeptidase [Myxococcaceae bacterium JPH2]|nr:M3 family metallopeptidase [Myxococcaceae bacterium JPH2]